MAKDSALFIGIDLGGTNIQGGILGADGKLLVRDSTKTKAEGGAEAVIGRLGKLVKSLIDKAGAKPADVAGLGIGAPGAIDVTRGVVLTAVNLRWDDYPLAEVLNKELKLPVVVDNDVNVGAWGEFAAGAGRGSKDMLGVFVGTGIGGGLILDGKLYHGAFKTAGEIGHTVIQAGGGLGRCTLENLASRTSIVNLLKALMAANHASGITELTGGDEGRIRSKVLAQAYKKKDPLTQEVIAEAAGHVGIAIANVVTLLSLPCVVVGGGVTEAIGKPWVDLIRTSFERHVFPAELRKCKILESTLGDDAGVIGAALLARRSLSA